MDEWRQAYYFPNINTERPPKTVPKRTEIAMLDIMMYVF